MRLPAVLACLALFATPAVAQQQAPSAAQLTRALQNVTAQREQALNVAAFCQGDEADLQQQLAAANARNAELTKELAGLKAAPTK
jgi:hypothetical protein